MPFEFTPEAIAQREQYWTDMAFSLTVGDMAPIKSVDEVFKMPVKRVYRLAEKLNELYEHQRREIEKSRKKK